MNPGALVVIVIGALIFLLGINGTASNFVHAIAPGSTAKAA